MEDDVSSFPLFNLPNGPLKCVLQDMELFHLCSLSILSIRSKELVKSLSLKGYRMEVIIKASINIQIIHQQTQARLITMEPFGTRKIDSVTTIFFSPVILRIRTVEEEQFKWYQWKKPGFETKAWIDHFLSILNISKVHKIAFMSNTLFDVEDIHKALGEVTEIRITDANPVPYIQKVVQTFATAKKLTLSLLQLPRLESVHNILCQNFDFLSLQSYPDVSPMCKLDDLLIVIVKDIILNGLDHQIVPSNQERIFEMFEEKYDGFRAVIVKRGYDIQRKDGTIATITLKVGGQSGQCIVCEVFVWH